MTLVEWAYLSILIGAAVLVLNDAINACTASVRELAEILRKDRP